MTVKKQLGALIKICIAIVVMAFLGMKSINFFLFTTPADQWYLAWLGFGLTGGGVVAYLLIFMWDADTDLKKTVSIVMLGICIMGELATAGFGMQVDTWQKVGFQMAESDFQAMVFAVQVLGFFHAIALIAYVAGDMVGKAFEDKNKNGIPDWMEKKNKPEIKPMRQFSSDADEIEALQKRLVELSPKSQGQSGQQSPK